MSQWVQHISGQGEKHRVSILDMPDWAYAVDVPTVTGTRQWYLPKSEYRLCEPPEQWVDVTAECEADEYSNPNGRFISIIHNRQRNVLAEPLEHLPGVFRLRKIQLPKYLGAHDWSFIVERKQP